MKPSNDFKRRKRRPKVKFKVEDINYKCGFIKKLYE